MYTVTIHGVRFQADPTAVVFIVVSAFSLLSNAFSRDTIQETYNRDPSLWRLFLSIQKYFSLSFSVAYHVVMYLIGESCLAGSTPIRKRCLKGKDCLDLKDRECEQPSAPRAVDNVIRQRRLEHLRRSSSGPQYILSILHLAGISARKRFSTEATRSFNGTEEPCGVSLPEPSRNGVKGSSASGVEIWPVA